MHVSYGNLLASYPGLCFFFFLSADSRINIMENEREEEEKRKKRKKKQGLVWEVARNDVTVECFNERGHGNILL